MTYAHTWQIKDGTIQRVRGFQTHVKLMLKTCVTENAELDGAMFASMGRICSSDIFGRGRGSACM